MSIIKVERTEDATYGDEGARFSLYERRRWVFHEWRYVSGGTRDDVLKRIAVMMCGSVTFDLAEASIAEIGKALDAMSGPLLPTPPATENKGRG